MLVEQTHSETVTQYLEDDHRRLDAIIDDICGLIEDGELERAQASFVDLDTGLRRHIRLEDEILFPLFDARTRLVGPTQVMRGEHRQIELFLDELQRALATAERPAASAALTELLQVLGDHNLKEEQILYPKTDEALSPDERRELVARLRSLP